MYRPTSTLSLAHSVHRLHWEMFPAHRDVTPQIYQELKGMIIHGAYGPSQSHCCPPSRAYACVDTLSSTKSVAALDVTEFMQWLKLAKHAQGTQCMLVVDPEC
jgi:hypothetical protein